LDILKGFQASQNSLLKKSVADKLLDTLDKFGMPDKVPDSFIEFNKKFNPSWRKELVEVFVDLFSMAVMMDI
jgi:hypothetical protein